jgi:hypothetical protein
MSDKFEVGKCYIRIKGTLVVRVDAAGTDRSGKGSVRTTIIGHWRNGHDVGREFRPGTVWLTDNSCKHIYDELSEEEALIYILAQ